MPMPAQVFTAESWMDLFGDAFVPEPNTGCWLWTRAGGEGYGRISSKGKLWLAHRLAYELLRGPIPPGLEIDHLCRTRSCVNPEHMDIVTKGENVLRGRGITARNVHKTHCPEGHELEAPKLLGGRYRRVCRECMSRASMDHKQRKREARLGH